MQIDILKECLPYIDYLPLKKRVEDLIESLEKLAPTNSGCDTKKINI
jgi:hypothetical protein